MALVSDPSAEGFNSYASVDEADEYFSSVYFGEVKKWSSFSDADKEALLITSTRRLSDLPWLGAPVSASQTLAFPRVFDNWEYGYSYFPNVSPVPVSGWIPLTLLEDAPDPSTFIPVWLKRATFEMALWIWTEDDRPATASEFAMLKSMKVGPLDYAFRDRALDVSPAVLAILTGLGPAYITLSTGPQSLTMVY